MWRLDEREAAATHGDPGATKLWLTAVQGTPSSAPIWRRVQPLSVQVLAGMVRMLE